MGQAAQARPHPLAPVASVGQGIGAVTAMATTTRGLRPPQPLPSCPAHAMCVKKSFISTQQRSMLSTRFCWPDPFNVLWAHKCNSHSQALNRAGVLTSDL